MTNPEGGQDPFCRTRLGEGLIIALVAGIFTLIGAFIQRDTDVLPSSGSPNSPPPPSQPSSEGSSAAPSTAPTASSAPPTASSPTTTANSGNRVEIGFENYFDVDARSSSSDDEPGHEFKIVRGSSRLIPLEDVRVVIVKDTEATSFDGCDRGTRLATSQVSFPRLEDDETVCVLSDQGAWATLKFMGAAPIS